MWLAEHVFTQTESAPCALLSLAFDAYSQSSGVWLQLNSNLCSLISDTLLCDPGHSRWEEATKSYGKGFPLSSIIELTTQNIKAVELAKTI